MKGSIEKQDLKIVKEHIYLRHNIQLERKNQTSEITRRINLTWIANGKLGYIFRSPTIPINLKQKVLDACIFTVTTYETAESTNRLLVCQKAIERAMLEVKAVLH